MKIETFIVRASLMKNRIYGPLSDELTPEVRWAVRAARGGLKGQSAARPRAERTVHLSVCYTNLNRMIISGTQKLHDHEKHEDSYGESCLHVAYRRTDLVAIAGPIFAFFAAIIPVVCIRLRPVERLLRGGHLVPSVFM
ncbi:MAG: hypothetical protein IT582_10720 [Opitutaceae bacterium]|nr:hypothetical protein [Opitutaceae bacterium]